MKTLYNSLAEPLPVPNLSSLIRYGFADAASPGYEWIPETEQRHKYHLSLIRHAQHLPVLDRSLDHVERGTLPLLCGF